ncbi:hypothetical protein EDD21DRAFT_133478 [Dissophora ornata]|nr:hypothetical protein EDD21DRAFT_133478 [Dissophora ornata]
MTTNHPTLQRTTPGMSQRKRLAAEAARKAKLVYPTTLQQPDAQDRVPTMSIADSALLQATLVQSRHAWTHTAFSRFIPEPPARGPGGKKYASDLTPVGLCTVCIGPHIFLDTKFYTVFNPTPPPPLSTSSTASNTAATTPTEESPHSPSPTSPVVLGGSPAPERVIELIMARTANMAAEAAAAGTVPETLAPSFMDIDIPATTAKAAETSCVDSKGDCPSEPNESKQASALTAAAPKEDDTNTTAPPKSEPAEKSITPTSSGTKVRLPPRQQRPKHQVAFEFKENPGVRWLFPHESSLELLPTESDEPARISASFYLPTLEEPRPGFAGTVTNPTLGLVPGPGQATTIVILEATAELWTGMQQSINDSAATYRFMMDKMKHIPPRAYVQYNLPITFPDEQLLVLGLRKLPDHKVVPIASLEPSKRTLDNQTESQPGIKAKRSKAGQDENMSVSSKVGGISRKSTTLGNSSSALAYQKQCVYCGCASTPMWRRGPDGSHTLCNACGVKWRHGRIYVNNNSKATTPSLTGNPSVPYTLSVSVPDALTTTAEAAVRMNQELYRTEDQEGGRSRYGLRSFTGHVRQDNIALAEGDAGGLKGGDGDKLASGKKRGAGKGEEEGTPRFLGVPLPLQSMYFCNFH